MLQSFTQFNEAASYEVSPYGGGLSHKVGSKSYPINSGKEGVAVSVESAMSSMKALGFTEIKKDSERISKGGVYESKAGLPKEHFDTLMGKDGWNLKHVEQSGNESIYAGGTMRFIYIKATTKGNKITKMVLTNFARDIGYKI